MIEPRASLAKVAAAHVRAELARQPDVEQVTLRLHACLARLVGTGGFEVLLVRALGLAKTQHPVLVGVSTARDGRLVGLGKPEHDPVAAEQAAAAVVAYLMELLVVLVGEELAMHLLQEVLDGASAGAGAPPEEGKS